MNRQHSGSRSPQGGIGRVLRGMAAAVVLVAVTAGLPWLFTVVAGSPIPDRLPGWDQAVAALSRRDNGTLLMGVIKYLAWIVWVIWTGTILLEAGAHLLGRPAPRIPGLGGPQRLAALLITSLGAAVIGTTASISRITALPTTPPGLAAEAPPHHGLPALRDVAATQQEADEPPPAAATTGSVFTSAPLAVPADLWTSTRPQHRHDTVRFAFGSDALPADARRGLLQTAHDIREHGDPTKPVMIVGHTDARGTADYNQHLSVSRARVVREALGQALGHRYRYEVSGKGETAPIAPETRPDGTDDPAARARNRRVEISYTIAKPRSPHTTPSGSTPNESNTPKPAPGSPSTRSQPPSKPSPSRPATNTPSGTQTPAPSQPPATTAPTQSPTTVNLPSGAMVGLSFAAGVGTALAASRLHRRRRHRTPSTGPNPGAREPEPTPSVRTLRRADLAAREDGQADPAQAPAHDGLHTFPLASSGRIVLGVRDGQEITVPIGGLILGLTGAGAGAAARALLLALLTHAGDHDVEIIVARNDAARLFELTREDVDEAARHIRALRVTADVDAAVRLLETERIHRARLLDATIDGQDLAALRATDPTEPLPRLVLAAANVGAEHRRRLEALCAAADVYDIAAFILGDNPAGPTLTVDETGNATTAPDGAEARRWDRLRLFHLTVDDARQILDVIRSAHGGPEPASPPEPAHDGHVTVPPPSPLQQIDAAQDRPTSLQVFGPPTLTVNGTELSTGIRGKARELLTYLAVHSDGAARDAILSALWPEIDQRHAVMRFHAAVNDVRRELRRASGLANESFVSVVAERYRIDPELISVDLWHFRTALHQASRTDDDRLRAELLQQAADSYTGHLAAEQSFEWIEPEREALRRQAVEALIRLAEVHEHDEPERGLTALERARTLDRYAEEIYQRIMSLQAGLGRPDAVRRTYRLLETALEELGADPSKETEQLLWRLLHSRGKSDPGHR